METREFRGSDLRRARALAAAARVLTGAGLTDLLCFLTPERIAAQAAKSGVGSVSAEGVRYHFRSETQGVRRFDQEHFIRTLVAYLIDGYRYRSGAPPRAVDEVPEELQNRIYALLRRDTSQAVATVGMQRFRVLLILTQRNSAAPYATAIPVLEHRTQSLLEQVFLDRPARERGWLTMLLPIALDALMIGEMLPMVDGELEGLMSSTAAVLETWATNVPGDPPANVLAPRDEAAFAAMERQSFRAEGVRARSRIATLAFMALGEARLPDLLAFLTPTTVSTRCGGAIGRLQVARAFSIEEDGAKFDLSTLTELLLAARTGHESLFSTHATLPRIDEASWRAGLYVADWSGQEWALTYELLSWLCLVVGTSDSFAHANLANPISGDFTRSFRLLTSRGVDPADEFATDAVIRETLLLWAARLRRWGAPWEGPAPFAWLVHAGNAVGIDAAAARAAQDRPIARAAFAATH